MSQPRQSTLPSLNLSEGNPLTSLTLVVLLLIPAVVLLLLLNCLFLGYKLFLFSKARPRPLHREDADDFLLLESAVQRARRSPEVEVFSARRSPEVEVFSTRRAFMSLSEPALPQPPVTSSRASSSTKERFWLLRRTGSGSLWAPSSIRAAAPSTSSSYWAARSSKPEGRHSAPVLPQSSDSEVDTRGNLVPPNSPTCVYREAEHTDGISQSSMYRMLTEWNLGALHPLDNAHMEWESYIHPPSDGSCSNTSGLDSDFGASAGVSLRILSADSDGLSTGVLASGLEWDYYDPCYVKQNHVPKQHPRPLMHTKQYWV
ncbi:protein huluwa isoform X2 [Corythoichthys intestinalis]|uniref:protein huluwa isoform X2 n=1 Tax=Corythoichthys intestinalis TaxID=161448 RepID=UPI0025A5B266|nr:protein huluwa isoform X2 [Corythoichthys intestinalis]XP_061800454.1 protein huluwa-like [Nerophis lumbriciformis]